MPRAISSRLLARALVGLTLAIRTSHADELATSPSRPDWDHATNLLASASRDRLEQRGLLIDGAYTVDGFWAPQLDRAATLTGMATLEIDPDLGTLLRRGLGRVHVQAHAIHGDSPSSELMDVHGVSGNAAPRDVRVFEAWYEQPAGPLSIRAGMLGVDQEYYQADAAQTLLGATFGIASQFSRNVGNPVYPIASPGVSARLDSGALLVQAAVYAARSASWHGLPTAVGDAALAVAEATWRRTVGVGAWHHSARGDGLYVTVETGLDSKVEGFSRLGLSPVGMRTYLDAGVRLGPGVIRSEDMVNVGVAFARLDEGDQIVAEATYEAALGWMTLQPDVQVMLLRDRTIGIVALRSTVVF